MPSEIKITNSVKSVNGNIYTITCDATKDAITNTISVSMQGRYPSKAIMYIKAFSSFLPAEFVLPA